MAHDTKRPSIRARAGGGAAVILCTLLAASTAGALGSAATAATAATGARTATGTGLSPLSGGVLQAMAFHQGTVRAASGTSASTTASAKIPTNVLASEGGQPVNEVPMVTSPTNATRLVSGANDYNCFGNGTGNIGVYGSSNSGATFTHTCVPLTNSSAFTACGDPALAYDLAGTLYATNLECVGINALQVALAKSTNNGATFGASTAVIIPMFSGGQVDKDWLAVDDTATSPHANALYISTTQFDPSNGSEIAVAHSSNGGSTWTNVGVSGHQTFPTLDQFSDLAITNTGRLYVSWMRCTANGPTGNCGGTTAHFYISTSNDGGSTWSTPVVIGSGNLAPDTCNAFYGCLPNTRERMSDIPAIGVDNSTGRFKGRVYASVYNYTGTVMQVEVFRGTSNGTVWSAPVKVGVITKDQFFPWLSVSKTGVVGVTWLDRRRDPANFKWDAYAALSIDGGVHFGANTRLSSVQSNPNNDGFSDGFMGDYTGNDWSGKKLHVSWPDTRNNTTAQDETATLVSTH
jgi:hypothetical protein